MTGANTSLARTVALTIALGLVAACGGGAPGPGIDTDRAMFVTRALAGAGPRPGNSGAASAALLMIEHELATIGVTGERWPVGAVDLPEITVMGTTARHAHRAESIDPDLVVRFGPPGPALLVMAHYDTVPGSPGAVDNAASVALLLGLARVLAAQPPPHPVMLAFTANEEIGLVGAEALAARLTASDVSFAIALDLAGGSGDLVINGASLLIGTQELRWLARAADRAGVVLRAPLAHRVVSRWWPQAERSDHGAFTRRGIRGIHFYNRGQDGEWIDLAYHSPRDVAARVDREKVDELGRLLVALSDEAPPAHGGDGFWLPLLPNTVIPRWVLVAIELALAALALAALIGSRTARAKGGLGLLAALAAYVVAALATFAVERAMSGSWIHAPLYTAIAETLVLGGVLGLVAIAARRARPWIGEVRYLVLGAALLLAPGLALLALGAAELAWIWLVPAAIVALAPRALPLRLLALPAAALPALLILCPNQLREAAWNGFLPPGTPFVVLLAVFALPVAAVGAYLARRRGATGPLGSFVLPLGCLLSVIAGVVLVLRAHPPCFAADFNQFGLACEATPGVR